MRKRINITLSEETIGLLDRVAPKGQRSQVIDAAITSYVAANSRRNLRKRLREGALAGAERDMEIAEEFAGIEDDL